MVRGFWQNDKPSENRADLTTWAPAPLAAALDHTLVALIKDVHSVVSQGAAGHELPLQLRVSNTEQSGLGGSHWFTIAYSIQWSAARGTSLRHTDDDGDMAMWFREADDEEADFEYELRLQEEMEADEQQMADAILYG